MRWSIGRSNNLYITLSNEIVQQCTGSEPSLRGFAIAITLAGLNNFGNLADDRTSFMNDINHSFVISPELRMNSGYTPLKPAAVLGLAADFQSRF
jgi:hypothetical protein